MDFVRSYFGTNYKLSWKKKLGQKCSTGQKFIFYQSNFLQNPYFRHLYLWKSRCVADILRQIVLNFSPKEYESEILQVQIIHDGFEDSLQQLSPANDIVMNRDYLEQGDLLRGIVNWERLNTVHRGAICQFLFRWIYNCFSSKSTGKKNGKTHHCAVYYIVVWRIFRS